jgi:hypothetical protein
LRSLSESILIRFESYYMTVSLISECKSKNNNGNKYKSEKVLCLVKEASTCKQGDH